MAALAGEVDVRAHEVESCGRMRARGEAFATLVTSDSYVVGAVVLASSLQSTGATRPIVCMVSPQVCSPRFAQHRASARVMSCASAPALAQVTRRRCG